MIERTVIVQTSVLRRAAVAAFCLLIASGAAGEHDWIVALLFGIPGVMAALAALRLVWAHVAATFWH